MTTATINCKTELKRTVPLNRVVFAAILDNREDIGKTQQLYTHWGSRGLKKLNREVLKTGFRKVILTINRSTNTATLPADFHDIHDAFVLINNIKIPLRLRTDLGDSKNIEDIPCEDKCEKCNQDKAICEDLTITEDTVLVLVNGITAQQTIIKKLYPDGSYYLETRIPVWDISTSGIVYTTTKEFITALDLKDCGCIDETPENIAKIACCAPDVYCCHFAPCDNSCTTDYGGYRVFEESGLIQFDKIGTFTKVYLEYWGFMPKKNGQYQVPEVAFETLVEWIRFKDIDGRKVANIDKQWRWGRYLTERRNMEKIMGRISLSQIIQAIGLIPKFDIEYYPESWCETESSTTVVAAASTDTTCESSPEPSPEPCPCPPPAKIKTPFQLIVVAGIGAGPTPGLHTYTNSVLVDALDVNLIVVNNTPETTAMQFTFSNANPSLLSRFQGDGVTPNLWQAGDVLVINYSKII